MGLSENWSGVMYDMMSSVGVEQQPIRDANRYIGLLYVLFIIIGSLTIINLIIGVSINKVGVRGCGCGCGCACVYVCVCVGVGVWVWVWVWVCSCASSVLVLLYLVH
jgi:hypothetical protein